jgi:hypothetical protein
MAQTEFGLAMRREPGQVLPHENWTDLETWVCEEVGAGRIADINRKLGRIADPKKPEDWGPERRLSSTFVESIILHDRWREGVSRRGVRILGALFEEPVDLSGAELLSQLCLDFCRFTADVSFEDIRAARRISLWGPHLLARSTLPLPRSAAR